MAHAGISQSKQTLHERPALAALSRSVQLLPKHTKAYRFRHIIVAVFICAFIVTILLQLGAATSRNSVDSSAMFAPAASTPNRDIAVKSDYGFAFSYDSSKFSLSVNNTDANTSISEATPKTSGDIREVLLTPLPSRVPANEVATALQVISEQDSGAFASFKNSMERKDDMNLAVAEYFAPKPSDSASVKLESRGKDSLGGSEMTKSIYLITPKFASNPSRTIVWTTEVEGKPFMLAIRGVTSNSVVPSSMIKTLTTLAVSSPKSVKGLSSFARIPAQTYDQKHVADLVSPSVVKIYRVVCGTLVYKGSELAQNMCSGTSGSGFIVSSDGYIATNGHVVVYGAKDMLAGLLSSNKVLLSSYVQSAGVSSADVSEVISKPELSAGVISKVYDLNDKELYLQNSRELNIVALGDVPFDVSNTEAMKTAIASFSDNDNFRRANIVGYNYSSKDKFSVLGSAADKFTASDVALIKIDGNNLPYIPVTDEAVSLNQKISAFGFPTDADNQLIDKHTMSVSVTNGSISAIRKDSGGNGRLFQSDVDASQGNSGGPVVDEKGRVIGLLTYRFSTGKVTDSAKSYIRDISDIKALAQKENIKLGGFSQTQLDWEKGLSLYSAHHYSRAITEFSKVKSQYPAHRLAGEYISISEQAIKDGKDSKSLSTTYLLLGLAAGSVGIVVTLLIMARHYSKYRIYRVFHTHNLAVQGHKLVN